jgi:hypothetical protein
LYFTALEVLRVFQPITLHVFITIPTLYNSLEKNFNMEITNTVHSRPDGRDITFSIPPSPPLEGAAVPKVVPEQSTVDTRVA